jgi:hypothetical protein
LTLRHADRNRLDRLPTRGERWAGIVLSALLAAVFLPLAAVVFYLLFKDGRQEFLVVGVAVATICALLGISGSFLFYRFAFTEPKALPSSANRSYAKVGVAVMAPLAALSLVVPTATSHKVMIFLLLFVALGNLARTRNKPAREREG